MLSLPEFLEDCYACYNKPQFARADPVYFLYGYDDPLERELVGLVASCLAYGRVDIIMSKTREALERLGGRPRAFLLDGGRRELEGTLRGFRHRLVTDASLARLLEGARGVISRHGSLGACVRSHLRPGDQTILGALGGLVREIGGRPEGIPHMLPAPARGSACKRLCLLARWMVRKDEVDPGGWEGVDPALLVVPIDTHMLRVGRLLSLTHRKAAGMSAALEVTAAFRALCPSDPTRYDFALTHLSMSLQGRIGDYLGQVLRGS